MDEISKRRGEWTRFIGDLARDLRTSQKPEVPEEHRKAERERLRKEAQAKANVLTAFVLRHNEEYRRDWQRKAAKGQTRKAADESLLLQKAAMLAKPLEGQPRQMAESRLLQPAREFLALGLLDEAEMHLQAAQSLGLEDGPLSKALLDADPVRREALAGVGAADELDRTWLIQVESDYATLFGSGPDKAAISIARKNAEHEGLTFENNLLGLEPRDLELERMQKVVARHDTGPVRPHGEPPNGTHMRGDGRNFSRANDRLPGKRPRGD